MKKNLKKTLCVVLSMLTMFACMSVVSLAADEGTGVPIAPTQIDLSEITALLKGMFQSIDWSSVLAAAKTVFQVLVNLFTSISAS